MLAPESISSLKYRVEEYRTNLQPFHCLQNGTPLPFTPYIQLKIETDGRRLHVERHPYTVKLHKAKRGLYGKLFGKRTLALRVHTLHFFYHYTVLRIPFGLKIKVKHLEIHGRLNESLEAFKDMIDESSYPLEHLKSNNMEGDIYNFGHPVMTTAKKLTLHGDSPADITPLFSLKNEIVCIKYLTNTREFSVEELAMFVRGLITPGSPVGLYRSIRMVDRAPCKNFLEYVEKHIDGVKHGGSVIIQMENETQLEISYKELPAPRVLDFFPNRLRWIIMMEVFSV